MKEILFFLWKGLDFNIDRPILKLVSDNTTQQGNFMTDNTNTAAINDARLQSTVSIVTAFVGNNPVEAGGIADLIAMTYNALGTVGQTAAVETPKQEPAVSIRSSVKPDYIVCLEDGKKVKMLKRHLMSQFGLTPEDYRAKWGLPTDYPMVAPNYSARRAELAKQIGLGTKGGRRKATADAAPKAAAGTRKKAAPKAAAKEAEAA